MNLHNKHSFVYQLYLILNSNKYNHILSWSHSGKAFIVHNKYLMEIHVLPLFFKTHQFSSFIRQLNLYGFRKIDSNSYTFYNTNFQMQHPQLLSNIFIRSYKNKQKKFVLSLIALARFLLDSQEHLENKINHLNLLVRNNNNTFNLLQNHIHKLDEINNHLENFIFQVFQYSPSLQWINMFIQYSIINNCSNSQWIQSFITLYIQNCLIKISENDDVD